MQSLWLYSDELIMYEDSPLKMIKKNHLVTNEPKTITNFIGLSTSLHAEAKPQFLSETSLFALPTVFGHVWSFKWSNPSTKKNMGRSEVSLKNVAQIIDWPHKTGRFCILLRRMTKFVDPSIRHGHGIKWTKTQERRVEISQHVLTATGNYRLVVGVMHTPAKVKLEYRCIHKVCQLSVWNTLF